jgi:hypothetical protein
MRKLNFLMLMVITVIVAIVATPTSSFADNVQSPMAWTQEQTDIAGYIDCAGESIQTFLVWEQVDKTIVPIGTAETIEVMNSDTILSAIAGMDTELVKIEGGTTTGNSSPASAMTIIEVDNNTAIIAVSQFTLDTIDISQTMIPTTITAIDSDIGQLESEGNSVPIEIAGMNIVTMIKTNFAETAKEDGTDIPNGLTIESEAITTTEIAVGFITPAGLDIETTTAGLTTLRV